MKYQVLIYTDGGCLNHENGSNLGAWATVIGTPNRSLILSQAGNKENTTSGQMEKMAIIKALEMLINLKMNKRQALLVCDAQYIVKALQNNYIATWRKRKWYGRHGKIKDRALWEEIDRLLQRFPNLEITWTRGHNHDAGNEYADKRLHEFLDRGEQTK